MGVSEVGIDPFIAFAGQHAADEHLHGTGFGIFISATIIGTGLNGDSADLALSLNAFLRAGVTMPPSQGPQLMAVTRHAGRGRASTRAILLRASLAMA
jgi:hypothetical protein